MKVLQINSVYPTKSTGRIAAQIAEIQLSHGISPFIACSQSFSYGDNIFEMKSGLYKKVNILKTRIFGKHGFYNKSATKDMLKWVDEVKPDIIHLHNIHGHYLNIKLLFEYLKEKNIPVVWTLHDCWAFTGHCSHFDFVGCEKWKTGCHHCSLKKDYPVTWFFDRSKEAYRDKKRLFTALDKMVITTPSKWLKELCKESFLAEFPVEVVNNGIDLSLFKPTESDFKSRLNIDGKFVILGIVDSLKGTKGGQYFVELSKKLKEDEVILLLTPSTVEGDVPENIKIYSENVSTKELSSLYTMADVFVNPSLQESFSMVNLESLACGTPVVTFNSGGTTECHSDKTGVMVKRGDLNSLYEGIKKVRSGAFSSEECIKRAVEFDYKVKFEKFIHIYNDILHR